MVTETAVAPAVEGGPARPAVPGRFIVAVAWLVVGIAWLVAVVATGSPLLDTVRWLCVVLVGVLLPGFALVRAVRGKAVSLIEDLAWGSVAGCLVALVGWFLDVTLPWAPPPWVLGPVVAALTLFVPRLRARVLAHPSSGWGLGPNLVLAGTNLVAIGWMTADYLRFNPVDPGPNGHTYYPDTMFQLAVVGQLRHSLLPQYPLVHGQPFAYHWFLHAVLAHLLTGTGLDPFDVVLRFIGATLVPAVVLLTAVVARRIAGSVRTGWLAAVLLAVTGTTVAAVWTTDGQSQAIIQTYWVASQTSEFGWLATLAVVGCVAAVIRRGPDDDAVPVLLLVPLTILAAGAKSADLAVLLVGVAFAAVAAVLVRRRVGPTLMVTALIGVGLLVAKETIYGGTAYGLKWAPFAGIVARAASMFPGLTTPSGTGTYLASPSVPILVVVAVFALWLLPLLPRLAGLAVLVRRRRADPLVWLVVGTLLGGLGATLAFRQPGSSEICFLFAAYPVALVGSAWGLSLLPAGLPRRIASWVGVAAGLGLTAAIAVVAGRLPRMTTWTTQHGHAPNRAEVSELRQILWWAAPLTALIIGLVVLAAVCLLVTRRVGHRVTSVALVGALLGSGLLSTGLYLTNSATAPSYNQIQATTTANALPTTRDEVTAGRWLAANSAPTDVLAVNRTCLQPVSAGVCTAKDFTISALAGRDIDVGGWAYAPRNLDTAWNSSGWYANQPFWDQSRLDQEMAAFRQPTQALLDQLYQQYGVRWLVADRGGQAPDTTDLDTLAVRRLSLPTVTIWQLSNS